MKFKYYEPKQLSEAISICENHPEDSALLAGGTDLLIALKRKHIRPNHVVNLKRITELSKKISKSDQGVRIGSLTTLSEVKESRILQERYGILVQAAGRLGTAQIRNLATIGGNLCNASPAAETGCPLLVLDARAKIVGTTGERIMNLNDFFIAPGQTALKSNEVLVEIQLPDETANMNGLYTKFSPRSRIDLATVSVAVVLRLTEDKKRFADVRIGLGAVAPTPIRAFSAEAVLKDQDTGNMRLLDVAAKAAVREASPVSDIRASDNYRKHLVGVLTKRTIEAVRNMAKHGQG